VVDHPEEGGVLDDDSGVTTEAPPLCGGEEMKPRRVVTNGGTQRCIALSCHECREQDGVEEGEGGEDDTCSVRSGLLERSSSGFSESRIPGELDECGAETQDVSETTTTTTVGRQSRGRCVCIV